MGSYAKGICTPPIFNIMVDTVVHQWITDVCDMETAHDKLGCIMEEKGVTFDATDG